MAGVSFHPCTCKLMHDPRLSDPQAFTLRRALILGLVTVLWAAAAQVMAQNFSITDGSVTTCSGILLDSGGMGGSGYSNNESHTVVVCPDTPGDVISLMWVTFNLNTTGPNPIDRIRLYDGNSTSETFLGEYTGTDLQNLVTQASTFNTTGCLTVVFNSNANGTGIFAASITCETPCDRPTAVGSMSEGLVPALICVGEEVTFDGTASYAEDGFVITNYTWDFADGNTADTPVATHSWDAPGEYVVQLYVLDNNDCANNNLLDLQVLVSTTPDFSGLMVAEEVCLGATVELSAENGVQPVTWTGAPENNFGPPVYLPDDLGQPFITEITFTQFAPGQTLTNINDLLSVCVDMEHSFMGDFVVSLTCPTGQSVIFHQQGGGGTDLGISGPGSTLGTCWNYCWSPTATNGTWVANSGGGSLPAGTYESLQPMSQLEGCALNGTWTFTVVDLWAADDGWICGWELNVDPSIIPDVTEFTPVLGLNHPDSAGWDGPYLTPGPNQLVAYSTPPAPGTYDHTFSVTDNFGCTYDTTLTFTVLEPMEVEAGPDIILCSDPEPMAGQLLFSPTPGAPVYEWSPPEGLTNPGSPTSPVFTTTPTWYYLSVYPPGFPECAVTDSVLVSPDPSISAGNDTTLAICENEPAISLLSALGGMPDAGGVWTFNGAVVPDLFDPMMDPEGVYTYTVTSAANCVASAELTVQITPITDPTCCGIADAGPDSYSCDLTNTLNATPGNTGVGQWSGPAGAVYGNIYSPQTSVTMPAGSGGTHTFFWIEDDGAFCYLIDSVQKTFTDTILIDITHTDAICYSYCNGSAQATVSGGNVVGDHIYAWSSGVGNSTPAVTDLCAGTHSLTVTDDNGCSSTATVTILEPVLLEIDSTSYIPVTCSGICDGVMMIYDEEAVDHSFNNGAIWSPSPTLSQVCEGTHHVKIRDANGCIGEGSITVTGPPPVVADFEWGPQNANVDAPIVQFHNTSLNANTYQWDIAGLHATTSQDLVFTFSDRDPADYTVCLAAFNLNMCSDTICKVVDIEDVLLVYVPTGFTPNGDGLNDVFKMSTNLDVVTNYVMMIFDRWGQVIFRSTDPNEGWDGSLDNSGDVLSTDVFVYRILYDIKGTDTRKEMMGTVSILK